MSDLRHALGRTLSGHPTAHFNDVDAPMRVLGASPDSEMRLAMDELENLIQRRRAAQVERDRLDAEIESLAESQRGGAQRLVDCLQDDLESLDGAHLIVRRSELVGVSGFLIRRGLSVSSLEFTVHRVVPG